MYVHQVWIKFWTVSRSGATKTFIFCVRSDRAIFFFFSDQPAILQTRLRNALNAESAVFSENFRVETVNAMCPVANNIL